MKQNLFIAIFSMLLFVACEGDKPQLEEQITGTDPETEEFNPDPTPEMGDLPAVTMPINYDEYEKVYFDDESSEDISGYTLCTAIRNKVNSLTNEKTILIFSKSEYDLGSSNLQIEKSVILSGEIPAIGGNALLTLGHINPTVTFKNPAKIQVKADYVGLMNMTIDDSADGTAYGTIDLLGAANNGVVGFKVFNVRLLGSSVQILGRNGSGVDIQNVTFEDFQGIGYTCNRKTAVDVMPRSSFINCRFFTSRTYYDTRGISFDAGNTEHPEIWDLQGTEIRGCYFNRTGIGFSKGENAKILGNYFENNNLNMDMIHMEEFTNNILIQGNTFNHIEPARGFYIDRERQNAADIRIVDNVFKGTIGWIISSYSPQNLVFERNDFTQATFAQSSNYYTFDFSYYQDAEEQEHFAYEVPTRGLVFRNNTGLSGFTMRHYEEQGKANNAIDHTQSEVTSVPTPVQKFENGEYKLKSKSGLYLSLNSSGDVVATTSAQNAAVFDLEFDGLQNYSMRVTSTGNYLEAFEIYTLSDMRNASTAKYDVTQSNSYVGKRKPIIYFEEPRDASGEYYPVYPGGNERKSRFIERGEGEVIEIEMTRVYVNGASTDVALSDSALWILEKQ